MHGSFRFTTCTLMFINFKLLNLQVGNYCPEGSYIPIPCPRGTIVLGKGNDNETDCEPLPTWQILHRRKFTNWSVISSIMVKFFFEVKKLMFVKFQSRFSCRRKKSRFLIKFGKRTIKRSISRTERRNLTQSYFNSRDLQKSSNVSRM